MIDTPEALEALVARALQARAVALDTEFVWERTYYPRLGVVQVGLSEDDCHLIDAAAFDDLAMLAPLLADPGVVKILHDAQQDLVILRRVSGAFPRNVFDTRRAAGFVGLPSTLSLGDVVRATVDVYLPKTSTRTDWLRRPLSEHQRAYALDDVRYLPAARREILARIRQRGREAWLREEMVAYDDPALYEEKDPHTQFERIAGAGRLSARQLAVLRELAAWREQEARRRDLPRGRVLEDRALAAVARSLPRSNEALASVKGLNGADVRRHGRAMLAAVERGLAAQPEERPRLPGRPPDDDVLAARINFALAYLTGKGRAEGIDPAMVAPRAEVKALVAEGPQAAPERHALLRGWRRAFLGEDLLGLLSGRLAVRLDAATGLPRLV